MKLHYLFYVSLFLLTLSAWSQNWAEKGHDQFQKLAYSDAISSLEKAVEKGEKSTRVYQELAEAYYFNANYKASAKWYQLYFINGKNILPKHYFQYAQALKSIGKDEQADQIRAELIAHFPNEHVPNFSNESNSNKIQNSGRFKLKRVSFNSKAADFSPAYFGNQIVFTSARDTGRIFKRNHSWTNQSFTDLYQVNPDAAEVKPVLFSAPINTVFNESTAVFTKDGLTMYFTRNNVQNKKRGTDSTQTTLLKIYKAKKNNEKWEVIGALSFCSDHFNVAHPALSPDEKTLYFASDMPGGYGLSDIYKVEINAEGGFSKPLNLGPLVNTLGRETFPFVSQNNALYFASDAHDGFGGLDVFVSNLNENLEFCSPKNIGAPINSNSDDFGLIFHTDTKKGFFTSNRSGGTGLDDIYAFEEQIPLPCETILEGVIALDNSEAELSAVEIILLDANANPIRSMHPEKNGSYQFLINCNEKYSIQAVLKGYVAPETGVNPKRYQTTTLDTLWVKKQRPDFKIGEDLAQRLNLSPLYFDLGKYNIRSDAAIELLKIKNAMLEYPSLTIEIQSHTDSRDTFENNKKLSDNRAQSTLNWLVENGISRTRLQANGYGETQLLNECADGIPCTEEVHQSNRRSEFRITGI